MQIHVPDYLILPFGQAVKSDLQKIGLSAVSADGLYFSTSVPVIFIRKSEKRPMCLADFELYFGHFPDSCYSDQDREADQLMLDHIHTTLKSHNPSMTKSEEMFLDLYFGNGENLIAVEIDGAEPAGYARDIRRDRLLRRAGVDVVHILNLEIAKHKADALVKLLPRQFFGFDWNYEGERPMIIPF